MFPVNFNMQWHINYFTAKKLCNVKCAEYWQCYEVFEGRTISCYDNLCLCQRRNKTIPCKLPDGIKNILSSIFPIILMKNIFYFNFIGNRRCVPYNEEEDYDYDDIIKKDISTNSSYYKFHPNYIIIILGIHIIIIIPIIMKFSKKIIINMK